MAKSEGIAALPVVSVPAPLWARTTEENRASASAVFEEVCRALTNPLPTEEEAIGKDTREELFTIAGNDYAEAIQNMNALFMEKHWGDGLPLLPPTVEAVEQMLKATSHSPNEIIGIVEPRRGVATVRVVAANAVMAGCKPEYLPVVLAAVKAALDPAYNLKGVSATTGHAIPLLIASGSICSELNISTQVGCMGPGYTANATIGRAFNLVCTTVGGRWPGTISMSTFSDPGRFTWCIGEHDAALPPGWEPLRVEKKYKREENTISVMGVFYRYGFGSPYFALTPEEGMDTIGDIMKHSFHTWSGESMLILSPDILQKIVSRAPTKDFLRKQLFERTLTTWGESKKDPHTADMYPEELAKSLTDDSIVSLCFTKPEDLDIIVTGGAGHHAYFLVPWVKTKTATASIDKWR